VAYQFEALFSFDSVGSVKSYRLPLVSLQRNLTGRSQGLPIMGRCLTILIRYGFCS
jgi:hypothetical protein